MDKIYLKDNYIVTELSGVTAVFGKNYTVYSENTTTFFLNSSFPINNARSVTIDFSRSSTIFNESGTVAYTTATLRSFFLANTGFKSPVGGSTGITVGTTPITSGVDGRVLFQSGGVVSQDSGFFWDNTNKRIGFGTTAPLRPLDVNGVSRFRQFIALDSSTESNRTIFFTNGDNLGTYASGLIRASVLQFFNSNTEVARMTNNSLTIGATTAGARLDVRAQGALSTDIAFRVRNSANTANIFTVAGNGTVWANGAGYVASNTTFGEGALDSNTTGSNNTAFGYFSLSGVSGGAGNTAIGSSSLISVNVGGQNTAIGTQSLANSTTGFNNVAIGSNAGRYITGGTVANILTNQSIFIGSLTKALADNQTNQIVIGHDATGLGSNTVVLGNDSIVTTQLRGTVRLSLQASAPTGVEGAIYYDSTTKKHYGHNGTNWNALY
jgi:hypothetical protein